MALEITLSSFQCCSLSGSRYFPKFLNFLESQLMVIFLDGLHLRCILLDFDSEYSVYILTANYKYQNTSQLSLSSAQLQQNWKMFSDKNIGKIKVIKNDRTVQQIQEIQQASILHIRSISEDLFSLMNQIDKMEHSIRTPTASPINRKPISAHTGGNLSDEEDLLAFSFLKNKVNLERSKNSQKGKIAKKGSVPAVHYASYMKPTHNMKQKIRQILISEREQKQLQRQREKRRIEELKQMSNKNYSLIQSRYHKYNSTKADKAEAIANHLMEKQLLEMSQVTFKPKLNNNVQINESFDERLVISQKKKTMKEGQIIKDMIKGHTYKPKINSHKMSQSKIKKIWSDSPSGNEKEKMYKTHKLQRNLFSSSPIKEEKEGQLRMSAADFDFVIDDRLFGK